MARPERIDGVDVSEREIPGPHGHIRLRVYRPSGVATPPAVVFLHGSGWVLCSLDTHHYQVATLAKHSGCAWLSVDYRLAPEHPFPAPLDDCLAAVSWVAGNGAELGVDSSRLGIAGDSAGGNLAAVVALLARDRGGPALAHQLLVYAIFDLDFTRPSYAANRQHGLNEDAMRWFSSHYLGERASETDWRVAPVRAPDLSRLPPARIVVAECDVLRDEGCAYAQRLRDAGVDVELCIEEGMNHAFWMLPIERAEASMRASARAVAAALGAQR